VIHLAPPADPTSLQAAAVVHAVVGIVLCLVAIAALWVWTAPLKESRPLLAAGLMYWFWACLAVFVSWVSIVLFGSSDKVRQFVFAASNFASFAVALLATTLAPRLTLRTSDERTQRRAVRTATVLGIVVAALASLYFRFRLGVADSALYQRVATDGSIIAAALLGAALFAKRRDWKDPSMWTAVSALTAYGALQPVVHDFDDSEGTHLLYLAATIKFVAGLAVTYAIAKPPRDWEQWRELNRHWQAICISVGVLGALWFPAFVVHAGILDAYFGPDAGPFATLFFAFAGLLFGVKPAVDLLQAVQKAREIALQVVAERERA